MANENSQLLNVCGGCNAKLGPSQLGKLLQGIPRTLPSNLLVGFESSDDAAVFKINEETAIIQTLDFFPTMVSDPELFGEIAATNALSDVYAMGGDPISALNIVCFPQEMDMSILEKILQGGAKKVVEAGACLCGGHSIHDHSPKYGLSVLGLVHPEKIWRNDTPEIGDVLLFTKKLGIGIITTGYSAGEIKEDHFQEAVNSMTTLNKYSSEIMRRYNVHAATDVTGFGLLGHLSEMVSSRFTARINSSDIPIIRGAYEAAKEFIFTAGGQRNRNYLETKVRFDLEDFAMEEILYDPQTSGGMLFSVPESQCEAIMEDFADEGIMISKIGRIEALSDMSIIVEQ